MLLPGVVEEDQVAQLRQGARMALGQIFPAALRIPVVPVGVVFGEVAGDFAQQDVDRLEGARRVFAKHDAEVLYPPLALRQFALARQHQVADEDRGDDQRADQRDDQGEEVGAAANHPGMG